MSQLPPPCAFCTCKPCTELPDPQRLGCVRVLSNRFAAPAACPLLVRDSAGLNKLLFGLDGWALRRLASDANAAAGLPMGTAPAFPTETAPFLARLLDGGRIYLLGVLPGQEIPAHLVRSPAKPAPKKEVVEQIVEQVEAAPPPKKEEKKVRTPIHIIEVPDVLFALGSAVPALDEKGWLVGAIATAVLYAKDKGAKLQERLIVCGHADTTGEPPRNYEIAEQRAQMVKAILEQNAEGWKTLANRHGRVRDYQRTLKSLAVAYGWSCDPGEVDNAKGPQTEAAVKAFQQECNDRYNMGLAVDGDVGPKTWTAIHRALCALVCEHLDITGTATPAPPKWLRPVYGFPAGQGVYSCGESFPVGAVGRDGVASEANRRVELVFAPKDLEVKAAPSKSVNMKAADCALYDKDKVEWQSVPRTPCASDTLQMGDMFWDFFQEHFPGKDDAEQFSNLIRSTYYKIPNETMMETLRGKIQSKSFPKPKFIVVATMRSDYLGAYGNRVIYLNQRLVLDAEYLPDARWLLLLTLLHEAGHYLDDVISCDYTDSCSDTPGEEGGMFARSYILHSHEDLLVSSFKYANFITSGPDKTITVDYDLTLENLSTEKRSLWFGHANFINENTGTLLVNNKNTDVEFFAIAGKGAVHEMITRSSAKAVGYVYDDNLDEGCAWPDVPYEADTFKVATDYSSFIFMYRRHEKGTLTENDHEKLVYNSHFGKLQHWHSMCPVIIENGKSKQLTNNDVKMKIIEQLQVWYSSALIAKKQGNEQYGLFHLAKLLHTVQDSYCLSHSWRRLECDNNIWASTPENLLPMGARPKKIESHQNWSIWSFQSYGDQDGDLHSVADQKFAIGYDKALQASIQLMKYYKASSEWKHVESYLNTTVYHIHPDRADMIAGESHPWFKVKIINDKSKKATDSRTVESITEQMKSFAELHKKSSLKMFEKRTNNGDLYDLDFNRNSKYIMASNFKKPTPIFIKAVQDHTATENYSNAQ